MKREYFVLLAIVLIAGFLRFYNLMFDRPYFFNPDEKNMAVSIIQLTFPHDLNPKFFAYGQFPLYLAYFSGLIQNMIMRNPQMTLEFDQAIFWLRFYSALSSTITTVLIYLITQLLTARQKNKFPALFAALFYTFTPYAIQSAHFGTTESLLTAFYVAIIYTSLRFITGKIATIKFILLQGLLCGLALATKVSSVTYLGVPFVTILIKSLQSLNKKTRLGEKLLKTLTWIIVCIVLIVVTAEVTLIAAPYNLLDYKSFKGSMDYESSVALGEYVAFYTRQFVNTTPFLFHFLAIFPFALGVPLMLLGAAEIITAALIVLWAKDKSPYISLIIILGAFYFYSIPSMLLFAKWTRFIAPSIALFSIFASLYLTRVILHTTTIKNRTLDLTGKIFIISITILTIIPGIAFFTIYTKTDTREQATWWIHKNIPTTSYILSETANVVDIPLDLPTRPENYDITVISFDFYGLDEVPERKTELIEHLAKADYIFIPSRRLYTNHLRLRKIYPATARYYDLLFSGKLGFAKIAQFSSFPSLEFGPWNLELADESAEESFTVFDHPVVRIYKKVRNLEINEYESLFAKE